MACIGTALPLPSSYEREVLTSRPRHSILRFLSRSFTFVLIFGNTQSTRTYPQEITKQSGPATCRGGAWGERRYSSYSLLTSALDSVSGQRHAPAALYPRGKDLRYPLYRRLGGPQSRSGHRGCRKNPLPLPRIEPRSPGRPVRSQTLYWLSYPASIRNNVNRNNNAPDPSCRTILKSLIRGYINPKPDMVSWTNEALSIGFWRSYSPAAGANTSSLLSLLEWSKQQER
jgi:hypothetical protein